MFEPGKSGNPAGRPPIAMHLVFTREMLKRGYDIADDLASSLKERNWELFGKLKDLLPYCFVQLKAKEIEIKSETPADSKIAADQKFEAAKEFAVIAKPDEQPR